MKKIFWFTLGLFALGSVFLYVPKTHALTPPKLVVSEIYYNPQGSIDTGKEWIKIYNQGDPLNIANYQVGASSTSSKYYTLPNIILDSAATLTIHWDTTGADSATDLYTGINVGNLNDLGGSITIFKSSIHSSSTILDYLEYGAGGQTWESAATTAHIWTAGNFIPNVLEGYAISRDPISQDTNLPSDFIAKSYLLPPRRATEMP